MRSQWSDVDKYLSDQLLEHDDALEAALADSAQAGLPSIAVAPNQGKLLMLLAQLIGAKRILEIGTLGGYSTIWLGRALPRVGGKLVTLEAVEKHANVARTNIERAGLRGIVEIRVGPAIESLPKLAAEKAGPFDLIFIDADKTSTAEYFDWAVRLARPNALIIVDNVIRDGNVVHASSEDASVQGIRRFIEKASNDKRVSATAIQTVGSKGYDGLAIIRVVG